MKWRQILINIGLCTLITTLIPLIVFRDYEPNLLLFLANGCFVGILLGVGSTFLNANKIVVLVGALVSSLSLFGGNLIAIVLIGKANTLDDPALYPPLTTTDNIYIFVISGLLAVFIGLLLILGVTIIRLIFKRIFPNNSVQ